MLRAICLAGLAGSLLLPPSDARGQQPPGGPVAAPPPRGVPVADRPRPDFDPDGVRLGAFLLFPELGFASQYDDNVFAEDDGEESDVVFILTPRLALRSDWNNHSLRLRAGAEVARYAENGTENYADYFAIADGTLDIRRGMFATARAGYERLHEERGSPNDPGGLEEAEFDVVSLAGGLTRAVGRIGLRVTADYRNLDFEDVAAPAGGVIEQDDRDRNEYGFAARVSYDLSPDLAAFVQGTYDLRRYDTNDLRDSDGYRITGGVALDFGGVTTGEAFVGYRSRGFDAPGFDHVTGVTFGASAFWNPTALTTLTLTVSNDVEEAIAPDASSFVSSLFRLAADHELRRNLLIGGSASYGRDDFRDSDRTDDLYRVGASLRYLLNPAFDIEAAYSYVRRESNLEGLDYGRNRVLLRIVASL